MIEEGNVKAGASGAGEDEGSPWGHWIRRGSVVLVLVGGLVGAYLYFRRSEQAPAAVVPAAKPPAAPLEVEVLTLQGQTVPAAPRFLGQTEPSLVVDIRSRVKGFIVERSFVEGQRVELDQVLVRIDPRPFEAELARAKADLASAEARLEQANQQSARYQELFDRGSVSPTELEEWQTTKRVAAALVAQVNARIAQAELDLSYTTLKASCAGVVGRAMKDVGSYVDDSANSLIGVLRRVDPIYVRYAVSEQEILRWRRLAKEGRVTSPAVDKLALAITLGDGTPYPHEGHIDFVDVIVDPSTGTTVIRGTVPNPEGALVPGQFVHVTVLGIDFVNTLLVPQRAVLQSASGPTVYVLNDGVAEPRAVTLAEWAKGDWIVEGGLGPGDQVVVDHLMQLRPGMPIVPRAAGAGAKKGP